jgi:succinylglutamic semialdehyde dehydrogenase
MTSTAEHFINQEWCRGTGPIFSSVDPATGHIVWQGHAATASEVQKAVEAAQSAFEGWFETPLKKRILFLEGFREALTTTQNVLAETISKEMGKPLWEAKSEVSAMIHKIAISIEAYHQRCMELRREQPSAVSITRHRPHGVLAVFGPFNFPGHLPNGHIIPALLAGNTVIFKPSELTPLVAEVTMRCWEKSALPKGVINLIQGGKETGKLLSTHPGIQGLLFTGSWQTGKLFAEQFASHPEKILALEMGGNNPLIVSRVSNLKGAAYLTIQSAYLTSGQRCTCARRLIVPEGKNGDAFIQELIHMIKTIKVGPYTQIPEPFMGPVISEAAANKLLMTQKELANEGSTLVAMEALKPGTALLSPGLIDVTHVAKRSDEEIFGPLLQLIRVPDFQAAIEEANNTSYGLAAGLLSDSEEEYRKFYNRIRAGVVNWNTQLTGASSAAPFGGVGRSGNHRPSAFYAADYCAFPVASLETAEIKTPATLAPGIAFS